MMDPKDIGNIQAIRDTIDEIDFCILKLFGDRNRCVQEIVNYKRDKEEVIAKKRQEELIISRRKWAEDFNLNPDLFEQIFKMLIDSNVKMELKILEKKGSDKVK